MCMEKVGLGKYGDWVKWQISVEHSGREFIWQLDRKIQKVRGEIWAVFMENQNN